MPPTRFRPLHVPCLLVVCVALAACGGGSSGTQILGGGGDPLEITTTLLPPGGVGEAYPATPLTAANGVGTLQWSLAAGQLPPGLQLDPAGEIAGTPTVQGWFPFTVQVEDDVATATAPLGIAVDTLALTATSGLVAGDAWTWRPVTLTTGGHVGAVTFTVVANESGGALTNVNPTAGTATWTPGGTGGAGIDDRVRATDDGSGAFVELDVPVMSDPAEGFTASFGSEDVWWIDATLKHGGHAYATDVHASLAAVGFRDPASTDPVGTEADELAAAWFRVELLRQLNPMFLRNADGTAGAQGLPIAFPFDEPGPGYQKPPVASWLAGASNRYGQMGLVDGSVPGVVGTAFVDSVTNDLHENDTSSPTLELGVFANQLVSVFNASYGNPLVGDPIDAADVPALRALLYELPNPGGRYVTLRNMGRGFARSVAAIVAHETGHSLGLDHNSPPEPGAIMNASASIGPGATYSFTSENVTNLQGALPGTGRSGAPLSLKPGASVPAGGVRVCGCRIHRRVEAASTGR